jgi:hypothetical protein
LLLAGAIVGALAAGIGVGILWESGGDDDETPAFPTTPVASSIAGLKAFATAVGHPVYWAGPLRPYTYELRLTQQGRVFVRYLPKGVSVGDRRASFLTVATYPVPNAVTALGRAAARGGVGLKISQDGFAYYEPSRPTSVYFARRSFPNYEVEVFAPSPRHARSLVLSGQIRPVG